MADAASRMALGSDGKPAMRPTPKRSKELCMEAVLKVVVVIRIHSGNLDLAMHLVASLLLLLPVAQGMVVAHHHHHVRGSDHHHVRGSVRRTSRLTICASEPEPEPAAPSTSAQNFDGSLDAINRAANAARLAARERGQAEGEDFDFCCPSAPDDLIGLMDPSNGKAVGPANKDAGATEAEENRGPLGALMNLMGF